MHLARVLLCVLFTLLCDNICGDEEDRPVVEAPSGTFRGHILKTRNGRNIRAFQGIPYAKPPLGKLRFKEPVKIDKLEGVYEANDESRTCFQPQIATLASKNLSTFIGGEDCLYINVYVPEVSKEKGDLLPVFLWIHGGAYYVGSGASRWNGPEYLLDKDMVMVTMNYRLGILGFLSRGDSILPGNLGMKDQVLAMKWVQDNIRSFGGDPGSVTLGGLSAGGSSVSQQLYSPLSRGLFHRAIVQSGTIDCLWSLMSWEVARIHARKIASHLGCSFVPEEFIKCLQKMPMEELFKAAVAVRRMDNFLSFDFVPVVEADSPTAFLTEESIRQDPTVPLISGVTNEEGASFLQLIGSLDTKYQNMSNLYRDRDQMLPLIGSYHMLPNAKELTDAVLQFYMNGDVFTEDNQFKLVNFISDQMFNHGLHKSAKKHKGKIYVYVFSYRGDLPETPGDSRPEILKGLVSHGGDNRYLFNFTMLPIVKSKEDVAMSEQIVQLWYNFVKTGDPTPDSKLWEESERGHKYLDITNKGLIMKSDMFKSRMEFLDQLNMDTITALPREEL